MGCLPQGPKLLRSIALASLPFLVAGCLQRGASWRDDPAVLAGESGCIYFAHYCSDSRDCRLLRYDLARDVTEAVGPDQPISDVYWDVRGDLFAGDVCTSPREWRYQIIRLSTGAVLAEFEEPFRGARISPDLAKLAWVEYVDGSLDGRLKIHDIPSGALLAEADRPALFVDYFLDALCWMPDSARVVFVSHGEQEPFEDEAATMYRRRLPGGSSRIRSGAPIPEKQKRFPNTLYVFSLETGSSTPLVEGESPMLIGNTEKIAFTRNDTLYSLDLTTGDGGVLTEKPLTIMGCWGYSVSPSAKRVAVQSPLCSPIYGVIPTGTLAIIDVDNHRRRYTIHPSTKDFRWIPCDGVSP